MKRKTASASRKSLASKPAKKSAPPIPVRAVDFVMYCTRDMGRTRAFYQKLFGLKRGDEWNNFWSEFKTSPVTLCLNGPIHKKGWNWQGPAAIALAVADIHSAIAACRRHKVKILIEPTETSVCWMAFIADPDGNRICLHQRKDGTAGERFFASSACHAEVSERILVLCSSPSNYCEAYKWMYAR